MFLRNHVDTFGRVSASLDDMLSECGFSTNTHNKTIYDDFRNILNDILSNGYASINKDIFKITTVESFKCQLSYEKNLFFT